MTDARKFDITRTTEPVTSFRNAAVIGKFDLQPDSTTERFVGGFAFPKQWQIGVIVGNSGTGKTTIARELFGQYCVERHEYDPMKSVVDCMPAGLSIDEIVTMFNAVGFSSPPAWLKPYHVLSNGQKMRVDLAMSLLRNEPLTVFDEFTSVVDRTVAQIGSFAVQKAVRRTDRQFIAVTCHFDVIDWLMPDWVFDTNDMTFRVMSEKKNDPTFASKYSKQTTSRFGTCLQNIII
jgi:ABC-type transport system involved in cytochrome bd biosynthesis fused ATPase/permease subunit